MVKKGLHCIYFASFDEIAPCFYESTLYQIFAKWMVVYLKKSMRIKRFTKIFISSTQYFFCLFLSFELSAILFKPDGPVFDYEVLNRYLLLGVKSQIFFCWKILRPRLGTSASVFELLQAFAIQLTLSIARYVINANFFNW